MLPTIAPGDWLLVDPTVRHWPRRGAVVLFREPETNGLAIKRVVGGPSDTVPFADGYLHLEMDEAWLLSDATDELAVVSRFGVPIDSRRYGPVSIGGLVGRVWFRYGPPGRPIGRLGPAPDPPAAGANVPVGEPSDVAASDDA